MSELSRRALLAGLSGLYMARAAMAQDSDRNQAPEYRIFDAQPETHTLSRHDITVDGRGYRLFLALPKGEAPGTGWPSIWMLDGNSVFDRMSREDLIQNPGLAVIGVGYPVDQIFDMDARTLDYTPKSLIPNPEKGRNLPTGGADAFRARLIGPIREEVEAKIRLDPNRRTIWGHSYGGVFALYCLLTVPEAFTSWVAASPSSGFGGSVLGHLAPDSPPLERVAPVHILLGDKEHRRGTAVPVHPRPSPETMALAEVLRARQDLDLQVTVLKGYEHGQTFAASFAPAMKLAVGS